MSRGSAFVDDSNDHDAPDDGLDKDELAALGLPTREREYILPAKDGKGQAARLQCRALPEIGRLVADIVASRKYPFRVQGDLVRFAVVTIAKRLAVAGGLKSVMAQADMISATLQDHEYQMGFAENFEGMKKVTQRYMDRGATHKARELITNIRTQISRMPDGYWRDTYEKELMDEFGWLLESGGTGTAKNAFLDHGPDGDDQ
jgi:hypothetical protein